MEVKKPLVKSLPFILATLLLCYSCRSPSSTKSASFPVLPQIARSGVGRGGGPHLASRLCTGSPPGPPI